MPIPLKSGRLYLSSSTCISTITHTSDAGNLSQGYTTEYILYHLKIEIIDKQKFNTHLKAALFLLVTQCLINY